MSLTYKPTFGDMGEERYLFPQSKSCLGGQSCGDQPDKRPEIGRVSRRSLCSEIVCEERFLDRPACESEGVVPGASFDEAAKGFSYRHTDLTRRLSAAKTDGQLSGSPRPDLPTLPDVHPLAGGTLPTEGSDPPQSSRCGVASHSDVEWPAVGTQCFGGEALNEGCAFNNLSSWVELDVNRGSSQGSRGLVGATRAGEVAAASPPLLPMHLSLIHI